MIHHQDSGLREVVATNPSSPRGILISAARARGLNPGIPVETLERKENFEGMPLSTTCLGEDENLGNLAHRAPEGEKRLVHVVDLYEKDVFSCKERERESQRDMR